MLFRKFNTLKMGEQTMFKIYKTNGNGTSISIQRGWINTVKTVIKLKLDGYTTKIVMY